MRMLDSRDGHRTSEAQSTMVVVLSNPLCLKSTDTRPVKCSETLKESSWLHRSLESIPSMSLSHLVGALVRQKGMKGSDAQVWVYSNCCSSYCLPYFLLYNNLLFPFLTLSLEKIVGGHFQIEVSFLQGSAAYILREAHLHELLHLEIFWIAHRELLNPVFGSFIELLALVLVHARYNSILGIVGLRCTEKSLERDQGSSNRKCWSPFIFQNV